MEKLKSCIQTYRKLDDELKSVNMKAQEIRREKDTIEADMSAILSQPEFQQYDKLEITEDNSIIKIQRPGGWTKSSTLSRLDLMNGLVAYFEEHKNTANATDCYEFIVERQKEKLVSTEFRFDRTTSNKKMKV